MSEFDKKDHTREALVIAAMELFAEEGFDAVSLRKIVAKAGAKNTSAIAYHFGTRNDLLTGITDFIGGHFGEAVEISLQEIEKKVQLGEGDTINVRDVVRALVYPYVIMISRNSWGPYALQFWSRALALSKFSTRSETIQRLDLYLRRFVNLLKFCLPEHDDACLRMRVLLSMTNISHGIAELETVREINILGLRSASDEAWLEEFVNYISGGIAKPS